MIRTLDELRAHMVREELEKRPFVLTNSLGTEYQAYWLDISLGAFVVPSITSAQAFHIRQLDSKGFTAREMRSGEGIIEAVARALEGMYP
jgi:hypothetical protein